jgi:maltooligosyltrehalose trehalohydrolase
MKRKHEMPFGAECRENGTVRFRLWAPKALSVELLLTGPPQQAFPMTRLDGGWFETTSGEAHSGTRYQFTIVTIEGQHTVPDPASRWQPSGVHRASEVIDPGAYDWQDANWPGRSWDEAVIYEMHIGCFTSGGTYAEAETKLDYLSALGVTALELMPVASFPGERNWGYDGVLPYAPAHSYGRPEDLKHFIDAAHRRNLMVFLDVVYNHFGPEGNYLWLYARQFFSDRHHTPWGQAINFDGRDSRTVRDYFIHNALYWLEEYHFDGLRLDAVHAIADDSRPDILTELAETVDDRFRDRRRVHLVLENDRNAARYLRRDPHGNPRWYDAQWNDDFHHAIHCLTANEASGYYSDYSRNPAWHLGRSLAEGFSYQGEASQYRNGELRGDPSHDLPSTGFVSFLQNHDQIGNRAFGERIASLTQPAALKTALAVLLLAPSIPMLFMGEEFAAPDPFLFFCDFSPEMAEKVSAGRRLEFTQFDQFSSPESRDQIPDPNLESTFLRSKIDWASLEKPAHQDWLDFYRGLLARRRDAIIPIIKDLAVGRAQFQVLDAFAIRVSWPLVQGGRLELLANLGRARVMLGAPPQGRLLYSTAVNHDPLLAGELPPHSAAWFIAS